MTALRMTLACGEYDRTLALVDGSVRPEGIDLNYVRLSPPEIFGRMVRFGEFDACEMSLSAHCILTSRGQSPFVGLPVFPGRVFRHSFMFVNADAGIERPEDLRGRRVGVPEYHMTAAVFMRGLLHDDHGVEPQDISWVQGGIERPGRNERVELELPGVEVRHEPERTLDDLLVAGDIDALFSATVPRSFAAGDPRVQRLFTDARAVERDWYARTRIYPIMHMIVVRRDVYERDPWVGPNLVRAFEEAKARLLLRISRSGSSFYALPFFRAELEETKALFGDDFIPYGIEANRPTLDALVRYAHEQGLTERAVAVEELFADNVAAVEAE